MRVNYTLPTSLYTIAEKAKLQYTDREIYYNYRELATLNDNTHLETVHTPGGKLSAATIAFEDGSELIITKEIVAVIKQKRR